MLSNGAHIYFLGTNALTAQGYHGNFYFDEFFWTHRFEELNKVPIRSRVCRSLASMCCSNRPGARRSTRSRPWRSKTIAKRTAADFSTEVGNHWPKWTANLEEL
ncbi:hypothetical protein FHT37_000358 [Mitsuaria sp. BK037]|nr:hypothetical protein [Mitsuaria sp. BK037]